MQEPKSSWDYLTDLMAVVPGLDAMFGDARPKALLGKVKVDTESREDERERATVRDLDRNGS